LKDNKKHKNLKRIENINKNYKKIKMKLNLCLKKIRNDNKIERG